MRAITDRVSDGSKFSLTRRAGVAAVSLVLASSALSPHIARAASDLGGPGLDAAVDLDFRIEIPSFLYFQVGSDIAVDEILFDMSAAAGDVGNGVSQAGTGGNLGGGSVDAIVRANGGQVTITEDNDGGGAGLRDGGNSISYAEVTTASSNAFVAPTLSDGGGNFVLPAVAGGITDEAAVWTYDYANTTVPPAGTYTGTVTYTAALP